MGFFGRLFRRDPATDFERARSMVERGELVRGLEIASDARRNLDDSDGAELPRRLDEFIAETRRGLIASIRTSATEAAEDDDYEDALSWIDAAQDHARHLSDSTLDRELAEQRDELEADAHRASRQPPRSRPKPEGPAPEPEGDATQAEIEADLYTESLLGTLAERLVPLYEAQPDAFRVAWVALNMGRFDEALEGFDALIAESPDDPVLHLERGRGRLFTDDPQGARDDFDPAWKSLGSEPVDAAGELTIPQLWVESTLLSDDPAAVVERLDGQEDAIPDDPQLAVLVGHALMSLERPSDARELLTTTYQQHPKRPDVSHLLAMALGELGEHDQAINLLETSTGPSCASGSCSKPPGHPESLRTLAAFHLVAAEDDGPEEREHRADRVRDLVRHVAIAQKGLAEGDHVLLARAFELDGDTDSAAHEMAEAERLRQIRLERGEDEAPETMALPGPGGLGQGKAALSFVAGLLLVGSLGAMACSPTPEDPSPTAEDATTEAAADTPAPSELPTDSMQPVVFPVQVAPDGPRASMEALFEGRLELVDGCLRLGTEGDDPLVVWPSGFQYGSATVLDETGATVARVGQRLRMGGGEVLEIGEVEWNGPGPDACAGPYFVVGEGIERVEGAGRSAEELDEG